MAVAAAIAGGAILSGVAGIVGSSMASKAQSNAADKAAEAAAEATRQQVEESRRQHDDAMKRLEPFLGRQNAAGEKLGRVLGFDVDSYRNEDGSFRDPNISPERLASETARESELGQHAFGETLTGRSPEEDAAVRRAQETQLYGGIDADTAVQQARGNTLAADTLQGDQGYQNIAGRQLAAGSLAGDERFQFAQNTAVVGDTFETSPGYQFAVDEAMKATDRALSRGGGNYGGRAVLEAQRRATGLAQQDYYNWVGARQGDLSRQDAAAASYQGLQVNDAGRLDQATYDYLRRQGVDIGREDAAVADARRREELDLSRGDRALEGYYGRRAADLGRQDAAIRTNEDARRYDQARQDQAYYNWLASQGAAAGVGQNFVGQAVGAGAAQAGANQAAYANQGNMLANIYTGQGQAQGQAWASGAANVNNAGQGAISNYLLYQYLGS